jgi:hypothetical protein
LEEAAGEFGPRGAAARQAAGGGGGLGGGAVLPLEVQIVLNEQSLAEQIEQQLVPQIHDHVDRRQQQAQGEWDRQVQGMRAQRAGGF